MVPCNDMRAANIGNDLFLQIFRLLAHKVLLFVTDDMPICVLKLHILSLLRSSLSSELFLSE